MRGLIDLHCHLDGSLVRSQIRELAKEAGIEVPGDEEGIRKCLEVSDRCESLQEYLECFALPLACLNTASAFEKAVYTTLLEASKEGVKYIELRFAPLLSVSSELKAEQIVEAAIKGSNMARKKVGIRSNLILCGMRHMPVEENLKVVGLAKEYLGQGVCGIDLAGSEADFPVNLHKEMFYQAKANDIPITIHAGECGSAISVRDAVMAGAMRIGHGIAMSGQSRIIEEVKARRIGIEMCPISNLQTKAVPTMEQYPFAEFLQQELLVTVNTDNRTVSNTTLRREYEVLNEQFTLSDEVVSKLNANAAEVAFADDETKHWLLAQI